MQPSSRERKGLRRAKRPPAGMADEAARARCDDAAPPELIRGIAQFNAGEFFEQHETLELLWRATASPVRDLYHGILQVGVGFHHWRQGNYHGACVLLEEGLTRLAPFLPECQGVDVEGLVRDVTAARARLLELGPDRMGEEDLTGAPRIALRDGI